MGIDGYARAGDGVVGGDPSDRTNPSPTGR
jgi:hypothetical protein